MAEEVVWNKKLLVVSVLLGALSAILFYAHTIRMEKKLTGDVVAVMRWKRSLTAGEMINRDKDMDFPPIPRALADRLDEVLLKQRDETLVTGGAHVLRDVRRGDFIRFPDILGSESASPSGNIKQGMRGVTLRVDPTNTPGAMLRVNDRVDIVGLISVSGKPVKSYVILANVRVLAVGGKPESPEQQFDRTGRRRQQPAMRSYRAVTVEVKPDTAVKLRELLPRVEGKIWVVLRAPATAGPTAEPGGEINPELKPVLQTPLPEDLRDM